MAICHGGIMRDKVDRRKDVASFWFWVVGLSGVAYLTWWLASAWPVAAGTALALAIVWWLSAMIYNS